MNTEEYSVIFNHGGFIKVVDCLGNDCSIVNAARISFNKETKEIEEKDIKLLNYLAKHKHYSPFRHVYIQLHVRAPEFVARQWWKHNIGSDYTFGACPWNEISGRYCEYELAPWMPTPSQVRYQSENSKQGSSSAPVDPVIRDEVLTLYKEVTDKAFEAYKLLCDAGIAKEFARTLLPLNFFTEWYWTASLQAIHHFVTLRDDPHAQREIREYAQSLGNIAEELFPYAWSALTEHQGESNELL